MNVLDFQAMKRAGRRISMVTCYDFWSAQLVAESPVDCVLVGDSVAMILHGHPTTLAATVEMMALHTAAVSRGVRGKFIVADLPFPAIRCGLEPAMKAVDALMKSGAQAVKIEGIEGNEDIIRHLVESGVPVMGHLGLTPQSVHQLGGYRVQGREPSEAERLREDARRVQAARSFALVLECVPAPLAESISRELDIPTIGIGAGAGTDGQVLVLHDLLGLFKNVDPKFVREYLGGGRLVADALERFDQDVKSGAFPSAEESYT